MIDEQITDLPYTSVKSTSDAEWRVIHAGKEFGPLSLAELVGNAVLGEIEADDLVKQSEGMWRKARELDILQGQFVLRGSKDEASEARDHNPGPFNKVWRFNKTLVICGFVLSIVINIGFVAALIIRKPTVPESPKVAANGQSQYNSLREFRPREDLSEEDVRKVIGEPSKYEYFEPREPAIPPELVGESSIRILDRAGPGGEIKVLYYSPFSVVATDRLIHRYRLTLLLINGRLYRWVRLPAPSDAPE